MPTFYVLTSSEVTSLNSWNPCKSNWSVHLTAIFEVVLCKTLPSSRKPSTHTLNHVSVSLFSFLREEEDDERFKKHFATYLADGVGSDDMEEIYETAHAAIRENPVFKPSDKSKDWASESKKFKATKLTYEQRKAKIQEKIDAFNAGSK